MRATDLLDRKLSGGEKRSKEAHVKKLKKHKGDFEKRYGDDAESVMYAVATKRAKGESVEKEGWHKLPDMDRERYQERDGLEGPIMTRSGKVVYYDNKEGKYYDPDTDMYIDDEDMRAFTAGYMTVPPTEIGEQQINEWVWVLPALATAARVGGPALLKLLKHGAKKVAPVAGTTAKTIVKNPGTTLKWAGAGYVFKSIHDVVSMVKDYVGDLMDDETIGTFAKVVWKYKLPAAAVIAVLYGGKKLKDYMAGEEEQQGNTTNNYNFFQPTMATEDNFDAEGQFGKALMKLYKDNEDKNYHTENNLLLAKAFGTPKEAQMIQLILKKNQKQGYTSPEDSEWMYKNIHKKYYKELVKGALGETYGSLMTVGANPKPKYKDEKSGKYKIGLTKKPKNAKEPYIAKKESIFDEVWGEAEVDDVKVKKNDIKLSGSVTPQMIAKQLPGVQDQKNLIMALMKMKRGDPNYSRPQMIAAADAFKELISKTPEETQKIMMLLKRVKTLGD
jgi:hypothetical protein